MTYSDYSSLFDDRDHSDWHGGIAHYGFWCVQIDSPDWLKEIAAIQQQLKPVLLKEYLRFPHITVATVGLMDRDAWDAVARQSAALNLSQTCGASIQCEGISSYDQSPMLRVSDKTGNLSKLRKVLHGITLGDDAAHFDPHVTLGYYSKVINIAAALRDVSCADLPCFDVAELLFCTYQTCTIRGPIAVQRRVALVPEGIARRVAF